MRGNDIDRMLVMAGMSLIMAAAFAEEFVPRGPWRMGRGEALSLAGERVSSDAFDDSEWMPAKVPGTVLRTLVDNGVLPDPYFGLNNKKELGLIPDLNAVGRDFYTAWFRKVVDIPASWKDRQVWIRPEGINYRSEIWLNGRLVTCTAGMFARNAINVTQFVKVGEGNVLAVKVFPVDHPGSTMQKVWAPNEWGNGGDGAIGRDVTMLMSAGWDFTFNDGVRDRNCGIWKDIVFFDTGTIRLDAPFVKTRLNGDLSEAELEIDVDVQNATDSKPTKGVLTVKIPDAGIKFDRKISLFRGERRTERFSATVKDPRLWWPRNKGRANLYEARVSITGSHARSFRFGIREAYSDQSGKDGARQFWINRRRIAIRGTNWIPEAMLKSDDERMEAEIRLLAESGVNLVRLWGGGIVESDRFYELCDEYGLLVWQEFWMTGDTAHPDDQDLYLSNVAAAVKRIRMHPSLCHYVASNESTMVGGTKELIERLDGTRSFQMQSECDGVHDGSPYKVVNPMRYYEDTASDRGSRAYGFNPEYGTCALPDAEYLRSFMPESLLWPIDRDAWKYREGGGFDDMTTVHDAMIRAYGEPKTLDDYCRQSEAVDAMSHRTLWESWNRAFSKRQATGVLFWYANTPIPKIGSHAWDHSLGLTSAFFAQKSALAPLHAQFDYLDNMVSVMNDEPRARTAELVAEVYDIYSRRISIRKQAVVAPAECCTDLFVLEIPDRITPVHFIRLSLLEGGKEIDSTVYWRSSSRYTGPKNMDGPTTAGFASLGTLPTANIAVKAVQREKGARFEVTNAGDHLAFMVKIAVRDMAGASLKPAFFTDNWMILMPHETRLVEVECPAKIGQWSVSSWNSETICGSFQ